MPPALGRRSRSTFDSDEESESTREATPVSTAPNDTKRARRSFPAQESEDEEERDVNKATPIRKSLPTSVVRSSVPRSKLALSDDEDSDEMEEEAEGEAEEDDDGDMEEHSRHPLSRAPSSGFPMNGKLDTDRTRTKRKHQPGAILRVKVTNFVTYTSAEFFPGPNLNMVIGPNGTGKSSLVCAICLGLGWGPQHLGRAKEVSEFIKNGSREATIEIELQKATTGPYSRRNPVFTRHMKREGNKSTWMINGTASNNKQILALARSFSVQIDNLCQFLPQDKVVEFAQMSPVALLESTQLAVAPELLEHHRNLIKLRTHQREVIGGRKHDKEQLKNLENRQEGQRLEVENTRRRAEIQQRLELLEKCRPITLYSDARQKASGAKQLQKELTKDLKQLEKEVAPALRIVDDKKTYEQEILALAYARKKELENGEKACDKTEKDLEACEAKLKEFEVNEKSEKASAGVKKNERLKWRQKVQTLTRQIADGAEPFDLAAMNEQIRSKASQRREAQAANDENKRRAQDARTQGLANNEDNRLLKARLEAMETQTGKQLNKLEHLSKDTFNAWNWIQDHQEEFQQPVFGPPMVTCSLKDPKMAKMMEAMFQPNDFRIITVQCQQDFNTCQRKLIQEQKLSDISIRVCSTSSLDRFQPPMPSDSLRELGLDGWAIDFIEGPPTVIAMLCTERLLHQNGVGIREINDAQYQAIVRNGIRSFVAGGTSYRITHRAEYGEAGKGTSARPTKDPTIWTDKPADAGAKTEIQRQINEKRYENAELAKLLRELQAIGQGHEETIKTLDAEIGDLNKDKAARQQAQVAFAKLPQQKIDAEEKVASIDEFMASFKQRMADLTLEKDRQTLAKAELAVTYAAAVSKLRLLHRHHLETQVMHIEALSDWQTLQSRHEEILNVLKTKRKEEEHAKTLATEKTAAARELYKTVQALTLEGQTLAVGGDTALHDILEEIATKHASEGGYRPDDLDADIDTIKADLELVQGGDQRVIKEFEQREKVIATIRERLATSREENREATDLIRETRTLWEGKLDELVGIISEKFGENFRRIGCAGSVVVHKANVPSDEVEEVEADDENERPNPHHAAAESDGNGLDFGNWALHISVKFREAEPLSLLDSHRQSGGERAVSTIFYLMALQSLSRAPFRVVDEINQGMDPRNERMVHGRMVDIAAGNGEGGGEGTGSQYFLVTPKLLGGLKYRAGMTVLCIVSGENMPATRDDGQGRIDFSKLMERARALKLGRTGTGVSTGKRIDSGVSMGSSFSSEDMYGGMNSEVGVAA